MKQRKHRGGARAPRDEAAGLSADRRDIVLGAVGASIFSSGGAEAQRISSNSPALPSARRLRNWTRAMTRFGQRYAGSAAHRAYVDFLVAELSQLGLSVKRDTETFGNWEAQRWALCLSGDCRDLPVAAFYAFSGATPPEGIEGDLIWLEGPDAGGLDVSGKIVAFRHGVDPGIVARNRAFPNAVEAPGGYEQALLAAIRPSGAGVSMDRQFIVHLILSPSLSALRAAGAKGVILVEDDVPALCLDGCYAPFVQPYQDLPALYVDADVGRALENARGRRVRLTLQARRANAETDHISAVIPGASDEIIVLASHTDGPNAFEENGSIGVLALAHHLASMPRAQRARTVVLAGVTGHMSPLPGKDLGGWFAANPDIAARTVAVLAIEHLGATEWIAEGAQAHPTGRPEQGLCFISNYPKLQAAVVRTFEAANLANVACCGPGPGLPGIAATPNRMGIPTIGYLTAPHYLISWDKHHHLDKFDHHRMRDELSVFVELLRVLDSMSVAELRAAS